MNKEGMNIIYGVLILSAVVGLYLVSSSFIPRSLVGTPGRAFWYTSLDGDTEKFHVDRAEYVTLLVFSASCPHCADIVVQWNTLTGEEGKHKGMVVGLSISPLEETAQFMFDNRTRFPVLLVGSDFMEGYQIQATPTTISLHNGTIGMVHEGPLDVPSMEYLSNIHLRGIR